MLKVILYGKNRSVKINGKLREVTPIIGVIRHKNTGLSWGVGAICPTETHLVFASCNTSNPELLWRALQAIDLFSFITDEAMGIALGIADNTLTEDSPRLEKWANYLPYVISLEQVRQKLFLMEPPQGEIETIMSGLTPCINTMSLGPIQKRRNIIILPKTHVLQPYLYGTSTGKHSVFSSSSTT